MSNGHAKEKVGPRDPGGEALGPSRSGKKFVIAAFLTIAALWLGLVLAFRDWKGRHQELAAYGAREVAPLVDPLAERVPPGVEPKEWRSAVADTHAMLETLTASGLLDQKETMEALRADLAARFAKASPETASGVLSNLWDEMQAKAGPVLTGRPSRPPYCPPRPVILGGKAGAG